MINSSFFDKMEFHDARYRLTTVCNRTWLVDVYWYEVEYLGYAPNEELEALKEKLRETLEAGSSTVILQKQNNIYRPGFGLTGVATKTWDWFTGTWI